MIYCQTDKGRAELASTAGKLGPQLKTLLGMVDGKTSVEELQRKLARVPLERLQAALERLAAEGYIRAEPAEEAARDLDFSSFLQQPVKEPTVQQKRQAEAQTIAGMRALRSAGYFVTIVNRPGRRIAPRAGAKHCVLILDSDQGHALVLARALLLAGFDARSAVRKDEILAELDRQPPPDLIVMDVVLPELVGLELLGKLREHPVYKSVPILVVTAQAGHDDIVAALVYGASGYMTKPCKPETLVECVEALLGI